MKLKMPAKESMVNLNVRLSKAEKSAIQAKANEYTGGNLSRWIKYAASKLSPKPEDVVAE